VAVRPRDSFFLVGPGKDLRDREAKLAEFERGIAAAASALSKLRDQWQIAVAADTATDVVNLENEIAEKEKVHNRMNVRLPVLRAELDKLRKQTAAALHALLQGVRADFEERAARELADARALLAEAVNGVFIDWLRAQAEFDGAAVGGNDMLALATV
jgi:hypothetical protein